MSKKECNAARRQLDEFTLAELAENSLDHLAACADCSDAQSAVPNLDFVKAGRSRIRTAASLSLHACRRGKKAT